MTDNPYLARITSEHRQKSRYVAVVDTVTRPLFDLRTLLEEIRKGFDLDTAIGVQLDQTGEWIGRTRRLHLPLTGVYFTWDEDSVGWGEGSWMGLYDRKTGMVSLPDDVYRLLLKAKVAANHWDGAKEGAYEIWESAFADQGSIILIQDNQDMSIVIGIAGVAPSAVLEQLLTQNYIPLKPSGVRVAYYAVTPDSGDGSLFAWDCDSAALNGWDHASWPRLIYPADKEIPNASQ